MGCPALNIMTQTKHARLSENNTLTLCVNKFNTIIHTCSALLHACPCPCRIVFTAPGKYGNAQSFIFCDKLLLIYGYFHCANIILNTYFMPLLLSVDFQYHNHFRTRDTGMHEYWPSSFLNYIYLLHRQIYVIHTSSDTTNTHWKHLFLNPYCKFLSCIPCHYL